MDAFRDKLELLLLDKWRFSGLCTLLLLWDGDEDSIRIRLIDLMRFKARHVVVDGDEVSEAAI